MTRLHGLAKLVAIVLIFAAGSMAAAPRSAPNAGIPAPMPPAAISTVGSPSSGEDGRSLLASGTVSEQIGASDSRAGERQGAVAVTLHSRPRLTEVPKVSPAPRKTEKPSATHALSVPAQSPRGPWHRAVASSYGIGDGFLGKHMACGGALTADDLTVAHRTLPCGTRVMICYTRSSGTWCSVAVVRDRGPYIVGRDFDLGPAVARAVHFSGLGTIRWRIG